MPTNPTASSGLGSIPARLLRADGTTVVTKSSGAALISAAPNADPRVVVSENIYVDSVPDGTDLIIRGGPVERQLKFRAGQIIKTSEWNACFPDAVISVVSPATGAAAGGTRVTVTGSGFTPDTTVSVGGVAATSVVVNTPSQIACTTGAHAAGVVSVAVTTDASTITKATAFTYV